MRIANAVVNTEGDSLGRYELCIEMMDGSNSVVVGKYAYLSDAITKIAVVKDEGVAKATGHVGVLQVARIKDGSVFNRVVYEEKIV